ncbi:bifunctional phosphopantothenoylcysteine decarboxylase/phosphopantothenate--cysteine ligase CoaBC [Sulfurimonas sp. HSL3-7]|uniref:bifunctional phosphopantothenoylcysteine decarboxylase/phosphopantothenate--cysteine ligase CoaBC n=1 Tax=Sulfonitrofixus jiaomeiensis TaxID=3131938 RepID=UPI0031F84E77
MLIPENLLAGKKILLGVTGSIAVYKSLELVRLFVKAGADVKVVMSESAKKFVAPLSFETLSRNKVLDEASESWADDHNHIKTTQWADLFVIAPCTANTIAKLANAIADNMLLQCALAYPGIKLIAPSANTNMLQNPITQGSLKMLKVSNYEVVDTQVKELACQTTGDGAMAEPIDIFWYSARTLLQESFWKDRMVMVTGGGTIEKIDDVRYISNYSSGKMASALAAALFLKGADVNLIATRFDENLPLNIHTIHVTSSDEMYDYLKDSIRIAKKGKMSRPSLVNDEALRLIQKEPYLFMAAAVSDYIPAFPQEGKMKKRQIGESWNLELKQNIDLLATLDRSGVRTVAFKAEMDADDATKNASEMIGTKEVDAVCLNLLKDSSSFGTADNQIDFITAHGIESLPKMDKLSLSLAILDKAAAL